MKVLELVQVFIEILCIRLTCVWTILSDDLETDSYKLGDFKMGVFGLCIFKGNSIGLNEFESKRYGTGYFQYGRYKTFKRNRNGTGVFRIVYFHRRHYGT